MHITASHTVRSLTSDEDRDLNIIREKETFMVKCRPWHGNKLKVENSTAPKVETVTDDDDDLGTFVLDIRVELLKEMAEQDGVNNNGRPIDGLDYIVDSYINMEVKLPEGEKELYGK